MRENYKNKKADLLVKEVLYIVLFILAFSLVLFPLGKQAFKSIFGDKEKMQAEESLNQIIQKLQYMHKNKINSDTIIILNPEGWYILLNPNEKNELCFCSSSDFNNCKKKICKRINIPESVLINTNNGKIKIFSPRELSIMRDGEEIFEISYTENLKDILPDKFSFGGGESGGAGAERPLRIPVARGCLNYSDINSYRNQVPEPIFWVSDYEGVIPDSQEVVLDKMISEIEKNTGVEIAIVSWKETPPCYNKLAQAFFDKWGIGKKNSDNGILIVFSLEGDKFARVQLGQGNLPSFLPDGKIGELIDKHLTKNLNNENIGDGLISLVSELRAIIEQNKDLISYNH